MKNLISIAVLMSILTTAFPQTFKGTVLDESTNKPISFATIYFNGTTVGTYSNDNGNFELGITPYRLVPITISAIGYYSVTLSDYVTDKPQIIYLTPKVYKISEVTVAESGKDFIKKRKRYLKIFRNEFLGQTVNASKCEIVNENDILFHDNGNDSLIAFASKPILINNKALGYSIKYYLNKFEYCSSRRTLTIWGNYIFEDNLKSLKNPKIYKNRKNAYLGSRMHFFRILWENKLDSVGYLVLNSNSDKVNYNSLVDHSDSTAKYFTYKGSLCVKYYRRMWHKSDVVVKNQIYFDKSGYFDPFGITWSGEMANQRIGDLLPYEYSL